MLVLLIIAINGLLASENVPEETVEILGYMTRDISVKYFNTSKCLAFLTEDDNRFLDFVLPLDIPTYMVQIPLSVLQNSQRITPISDFEEYAWESFLLPPLDAGCLAFVIQTSNITFMVKSFARLAHSPKSTYRANRRFLYLPASETPGSLFESHIKDLYVKREMDFMPDIVVAKLIITDKEWEMDQDNSSETPGLPGERTYETNITIELITHQYVGPISSQRLSLDTWTLHKGFNYNNDIYPDKLSNLMGKRLVMTSFSYPPVSVVIPDEKSPIYDGLEFRIINEWSIYNNFTWSVHFRPEEGWSIIWDNGSGLGLTGNVASDKVDVGFGAIYLWERDHLYVDYSSIYFTTFLTTVVPRPKLLPGWTVIVSPFALDMWLAIGIAFILITFIVYWTAYSSMKLLGRGKIFTSMYSTLQECAFRNLGLLVLQVPPDERDWSTPRFVPMRHLITWLILFYFVVTTAYSGGLATVLTLPRYEKPIETPHDMADHKTVWGALDDVFVAFLKDSYDPKMREVAANNIVESEEYFEKLIPTGEIGFVIEMMQNGHFAMAPFINEQTMEKLRLMREMYVAGHCAYALRKGSPYMSIMNPILRKLRDAGIVLYWEDSTVRKFMSTRDQLAVINSRRDPENSPTQMQLRHLTGSFLLLMTGEILSFFVFSFELSQQFWERLNMRNDVQNSSLSALKQTSKKDTKEEKEGKVFPLLKWFNWNK
ncbi:Ionotropic receptor 41a14 [Blattella germanica]|nr:Ionotropic receptor 41a14 [Blattella germanica]